MSSSSSAAAANTAANAAQGQGQGIDITTLPVQQLSQLQTRLSQELEHLSTSYQRLRQAQNRFRDCIRSVKDGVEAKKGGDTSLLIPLTTSLYVPARLSSSSSSTADADSSPTVLVDVGTGFFVEKSTTDAIKFYNAKVDELTSNLSSIEKVVGGKTENLRIVEDVLRQKVLAQQAQEKSETETGAGGKEQGTGG